MTLGPVMLDIEGTALTEADRQLLRRPAVGGVILFERNFADRAQLRTLCDEIHSLRTPPLLIAVDQEGGRVQRFREGFTRLPAAALIGRLYDRDHRAGVALARSCGYVMAAELLAAGVDLSFAPVLDLAAGVSEVIGGRAYHRTAQGVGDLAGAVVSGMRSAGMQATGKHFPGHGHVAADSHHTLPVDRRLYEDITDDLAPFERLVRADLAAVMTAHVLYPDVDGEPATFSRRWLQGELRRRLGFRGVIFSDDLTMGGALGIGTAPERARRALGAGCDMVLVCNDRAAARAVVAALDDAVDPVSAVRPPRMHGKVRPPAAEDTHDEHWHAAAADVARHMGDRDFQLQQE